MKVCNRCKEEKPLSEFYTAGTYKDGTLKRRNPCKACQSKRKKLHRLNNIEWYKERDKNTRKKIQGLVYCYLNIHGCYHCGENDPRCLEFHHINPEEKEYAISTMYNRTRIEKITKEINKCMVLCSNCHKLEHARLRDS